MCLYDRRGHRDIYGKELRSTIVCVVDNIAGIANLIFGEADERIPVCIIKGLGKYLKEDSVRNIIRDESKDVILKIIREYKKIKNLKYIII